MIADAISAATSTHRTAVVAPLRRPVTGDRIDPDSLPLRGLAVATPSAASGTSVGPLPVGSSIAEVEQQLILATMEHCGGDKKQAAETLGISLKTLYNKLGSYGETKKRGPASVAPNPLRAQENS